MLKTESHVKRHSIGGLYATAGEQFCLTKTTEIRLILMAKRQIGGNKSHQHNY